jgi:hypothetical protein
MRESATPNSELIMYWGPDCIAFQKRYTPDKAQIPNTKNKNQHHSSELRVQCV